MSETVHPLVTPVVELNDLKVAAEFRGVLTANGLDSLDALFSYSDGESLSKPGLSPWRERRRLTLDDRGHRHTFYLKRFRHPPWTARRDARCSGSGARSIAGTEWAWMHRLGTDGVPCVRPVAFGEELRGAKEVRSAVLTSAVPGASLEHWAARWGEDDRPTIRGLIPVLADLVARLHACGYAHRDLYLSHVFHDPGCEPAASLCLIDLQRLIRPRLRQRRWIIKDLASLDYSAPFPLVSRTDRVRWLTRYLGSPKLSATDKRLCYRIIGKTRRIAEHDRRRRDRWRGRNGGR